MGLYTPPTAWRNLESEKKLLLRRLKKVADGTRGVSMRGTDSIRKSKIGVGHNCILIVKTLYRRDRHEADITELLTSLEIR